MKRTLSILLALAVLTVSLFALAACGGKDTLTIAVPNDTTNEARAMILLQENGIIKLKDDAGITATINDIVENPLNISFKEVEAAQIPSILPDVDYAVINSNYAIAAGMKPEMHAEGMHAVDHLLVIRCKKRVEDVPAEKGGSLCPEIVAGKYRVHIQLFFGPFDHTDIEPSQFTENLMDRFRIQIKIHQRVLHSADAPVSLEKEIKPVCDSVSPVPGRRGRYELRVIRAWEIGQKQVELFIPVLYDPVIVQGCAAPALIPVTPTVRRGIRRGFMV